MIFGDTEARPDVSAVLRDDTLDREVIKLRKRLYKTMVRDVEKGSESLTNNFETYLRERS
jgi:hypothetical protein